MTDPETQLDTLFARYDPALAALGRALRKRMRARLPGLSEVVYYYEGRSALVISYSATGKGYDGVCSTSLRPDGASLYFMQLGRSPQPKGEAPRADEAGSPEKPHVARSRRGIASPGDRLAKADTSNLLQGSGKGARHVTLRSLADFDRPEIEVLIAAALDLAGLRLDASARGDIVFRVESQRKRSRSAGKSAAGGAGGAAGTAATTGTPGTAASAGSRAPMGRRVSGRRNPRADR